MKKILSALSICLLAGPLSAQAPVQNKCHSTEMMEANFKKHPELRQQYENCQAQLKAEQEASHNIAQKTAVANYTIPIVFHILHQNGVENISDAQIMDQLAILNRDYNLENTDTSEVITPFKNMIGNAHFTFVLAKLDPNGNCNTGINRYYEPNTANWQGNLSDYIYTWDPIKYLNVYVVKQITSPNSNSTNGGMGYTYYPGSLATSSRMDAIVITHNCVGSIGTAQLLSFRILTHEVGHWFNLLHPWGTTYPGVCGDDQVTDTPVTQGGFYNCPTEAGSQICNPGIAENYQNFMEESYCRVMFTNGQAARMAAAIQSTVAGRDNLSSPANLAATGITPAAPCTPAARFTANKFTICAGSTVNFTDLSNVTSSPTAWTWTFDGGSPNTSTVQNPTVIYNTPGNYSVQLVASNAFGASAPETEINYITVLPSPINTFLSEGFEGGPIPNSTWYTKNEFSNTNWQQTAQSAATGSMSVYVDESLLPGSYVELYSPVYNFSAMPNLALTLKWAGAERNTSSTDYDVFSVQFSTNCGQTWTPRLVRNIKTSTAGVSGAVNGNFVPTASQFKQEVITLGSLVNQNNVVFKLKFVAESGSSNNFYVDDINLTSSTFIKEDNPVLNFAIYPNPAKDNLFVSFDLLEDKLVEVQLKDVLGRTVKQSAKETMANGHHEMPFVITDLSSGIYFVSVTTNGTVTTQKIVIE